MITWQYFQYNVSVALSIQHNSQVEFPAVTVCNNSPLRKSALKDLANVQESVSYGATTEHDEPITTTGSAIRDDDTQTNPKQVVKSRKKRAIGKCIGYFS